MEKSLLILHIIYYDTDRKNALQLSKIQLILHPEPLVRVEG